MYAADHGFGVRTLVSLMAAVLALCAPLAGAAVQADQPRFVVTTEEVSLRCDQRDRAYAVTRLDAGTVLLADRTADGWVRVAYPSGLSAFVRSDAISGDPSAQTIRVTDLSQLRAANSVAGPNGSWKSLTLTDNAPTQATLRRLERIEARGGRVWFRVEAPPQARGFVREGSVRAATDGEARAAGFDPSDLTRAQASRPSTPAPSQPAQTPEAQNETPERDNAFDMTEPMREPSEDDRPTTVTQEPDRPATQPAPSEPIQVSPRLQRFIDIDESFQRVMSQPAEQAELDELISDLELALADLPANDSTATRVRALLQQRLELAQLRRDWRDSVLAREETTRQLTSNEQAVQNAVAQARSTGVYTMIGRLERSSVYDGSRLPQMFRLRSVGEPISRTIGYIEPDDTPNLRQKLGQVVGVVGTASIDPERRMNVIKAVSVEVIDPTRTP